MFLFAWGSFSIGRIHGACGLRIAPAAEQYRRDENKMENVLHKLPPNMRCLGINSWMQHPQTVNTQMLKRGGTCLR